MQAVKRSTRRLSDLVTGKLETIGPKVSASVAWSKMQKRGVRHLLVADDGRTLGVVSEGELGRDGSARVRQRGMVEDLMSPRVISVESTTTLNRAASLIHDQRVGCLLVTDKGRPVGIVTASDVFEELGRDAIRTPFPGYLPRPVKREPSTPVQLVPAHIRVLGIRLSTDQRKRIRRDLGAKLGKYAASIERVTVRVEDMNGPRGGIDQSCRIKVVLSGLPSVVFESRNSSLDAATRDALAGAERAVRRALQRRRLKPIQAVARADPNETDESEF